MTDPIATALLAWHDFFAAVTGIAGVLIGLLFVVIGLTPSIMTDTRHQGMRVLTAQTFHTFLALIVIGLSALVPSDHGTTLAISLVVCSVLGFGRMVREVRLALTDPDPKWNGHNALTRVASPVFAYGMALTAAYGIWRQDTGALDWLIGVVLLLTVSAAAGCWDLMAAIGNQAGSASG